MQLFSRDNNRGSNYNALLSPYTSLAPGINAAGTAGANVGMMANPAALGKTAAQQLSGGITTINPGVTGALSPVPRGNACRIRNAKCG
jgi:hypothetical protein